MSKKNKFLVFKKIEFIIVVVCAALGLPVGLLAIPEVKELFFPTPKDYTDPDNEFKLKYPKDWQAKQEDPTPTGTAAEFSPPKDKTSTSCPASVIVGYSKSGKIRSLEEYTKSVILPEIKFDFPNIQLPSPTLVNLAQHDANQAIYSGRIDNCNWKKLDIWTVKNLKEYRITYQAEISEYPTFEKAAKAIIETFEFPKETPTR